MAPHGSSRARRTILMPAFLVGVVARQLVERAARADVGRRRAGDDAFFHRARVACRASLDAGLLSFISISVAAPTLTIATPRRGLATRS